MMVFFLRLACLACLTCLALCSLRSAVCGAWLSSYVVSQTCAAVDVEEHVWELEGKVISGHEVGETRAAIVEESQDGTAPGPGYGLSFLSSMSDTTSGDDVSLEVDDSSSCSERGGGGTNGRGLGGGAIKSPSEGEDAGVDDLEAARSGASEEWQVHKELNRVLATVSQVNSGSAGR